MEDRSSDTYIDIEEEDGPSSPFDIVSTKGASLDRLRRWRQATLVLNASRRFRYTLDLKRVEEKARIRRKIEVHAQVIRAAVLFKAEGERRNGHPILSPTPANGFDIGQEQLARIVKDSDHSALQQYGGVRGLARMLKTNLQTGIDGDNADLLKRRNAYGSNTFRRKKRWIFLRLLWEAWKNPILTILMVAAIICMALDIHTKGNKEWFDGASIAFAVIFVVVVTATSDYWQSLQFQNINGEEQNITLEVIRGGRRVMVSIFDIVVGDVLPLNIGDQVPADGILISGCSFAIDESSVTGESKIVQKDLKAPFLMSGCNVADGCGTMLVTSVGIHTTWGLLMTSISEDTGEETPLQVRLNGLTTLFGYVGLTVALAVLIIFLIRYFSGHTRNLDGTFQFVHGKTRFVDAMDDIVKIITIGVSIAVLAVPEGLPLAVTLTLAYSMRKMIVEKSLVRRLSACEVMGSVTTICCNKSGTLTLNQMSVVEAYVGAKKIEPPDNRSLLPPMAVSLLVQGIAQNTMGCVYTHENGDVDIAGSPTEKAILGWGLKIGMNFGAIRSNSSVIHASPFNPVTKRGGIALQLMSSEVHVHWKGAAEVVLALCTRYIDANNQLVPMDKNKLNFWKRAIEDMAARSLRCVAIAYKSYEMESVPTEELAQWTIPEDDLILLAVIGLKDPCRPGTRNVVEMSRSAGIKVCLVTGDNVHTASAVAFDCGILDSTAHTAEQTLIEGRVFRALSEAERQKIVENILVMARSSPNDKVLLVKALKKRGHVVAVTGGRTSDAPALHEADVGLAMGIQGTEVAKQSSDIIILDDNFASVIKVFKRGRSIHADIRKFIQFQFTVNITAIVVDVVSWVSSSNVPLNAVQILWINLVMDTLGPLALATEPPTDKLLHSPPVGRREPLLTNISWRNTLIQVVYQVSVLLVINFQATSILYLKHDTNEHAVEVKNALIHNILVLCQIFNAFNCRRQDEINIFEGITRHHLFLGIVALILLLQVIVIEFLGKFTSSTRLNWRLWLISFGFGFISWPLGLIGKLIPVPDAPFHEFFARILH